jgi:hypothetical protein
MGKEGQRRRRLSAWQLSGEDDTKHVSVLDYRVDGLTCHEKNDMLSRQHDKLDI